MIDAQCISCEESQYTWIAARCICTSCTTRKKAHLCSILYYSKLLTTVDVDQQYFLGDQMMIPPLVHGKTHFANSDLLCSICFGQYQFQYALDDLVNMHIIMTNWKQFKIF